MKKVLLTVLSLTVLLLLTACGGNTDKSEDTSTKATVVKDNQAISSIKLQNDGKEMFSFFLNSQRMSSKMFTFEDFNEKYPVEELKKANTSEKEIYYAKYQTVNGSKIFVFFEDSSFIPDFILDYSGTVWDYSGDENVFKPTDKEIDFYKTCIWEVDL